jgi:hypothetical protein
MSVEAMAAALASRRPGPRSFVRDRRDEQHINAIPKRSANSIKTAKNPGGRWRFASSSPGASIGLGALREAIAGHCCSPATGRQGRSDRESDFACPAGSLLTRKFRVAITGTIGFRPIDCAFRD